MRKTTTERTPQVGDWPYFSTAKQSLIIEMARLYPDIKLVYFYKVRQEDGALIRGGTEPDPTVYSFFAQIGYKHLEMHKTEAQRIFRSKVVAQIGRDLTQEEVKIAFRPVMTTFRSVFVDDVPPTVPAHILIETSPGNWQGHFLLSRPVAESDAAKIQKYMIKRLGGDPGAGSPVQARRFPENRFIFEPMREPLNVDQILEETQAEAVPRKEVVIDVEYNSDVWTDDALHQLYQRLQKGRTDLSACDASFCVYLAAKGMDDTEIYEALLKSSPEIAQRHPNLDYYINRTITAAHKHI